MSTMKALQTPDDSALLHGNRQYDPNKAHAYYLRTRHLKGRRSPGFNAKSNSGTPQKTVASVHAAKTKRIAEVKARHKALEIRLSDLKDNLALLVQHAKARSGVETKTSGSSSTSTSTSSSSASSKGGGSTGTSTKSAAQKAKDAKRAKEKYDKEIKPITKQNKELEQQIKEVQTKIADMHKKLSASVERARKDAVKPKSRPADKHEPKPKQKSKP